MPEVEWATRTREEKDKDIRSMACVGMPRHLAFFKSEGWNEFQGPRVSSCKARCSAARAALLGITNEAIYESLEIANIL